MRIATANQIAERLHLDPVLVGHALHRAVNHGHATKIARKDGHYIYGFSPSQYTKLALA
jgi:hypothetical protein